MSVLVLEMISKKYKKSPLEVIFLWENIFNNFRYYFLTINAEGTYLGPAELQGLFTISFL